MGDKNGRESHPETCHGCRHSLRYATICEGREIHDGLCLRPKHRTMWGSGCRHYSEAQQKAKRWHG